MRVGLVCPYSFDVPGRRAGHVRDLAEALHPPRARGHRCWRPADDDSALPPYVVPAGRAVPVPYNGSVARLRVRPGVRARGCGAGCATATSTCCTCTSRRRRACRCWPCWAAIGPIVATFHAAIDAVARDAGGVRDPADRRWRRSARRIAVSEAARDDPRRPHRRRRGADPQRRLRAAGSPPRTALPELAGRGTAALGFLGRIDEPRKGLPVLLAALPAIAGRAPGARLLVAGPGDVDEVRDALDPAVRDRVQFLGLVSESDKARAAALGRRLRRAPTPAARASGSSWSRRWPAGRRCWRATSTRSAGARRREGGHAVRDRRPGRPRAAGRPAARPTRGARADGRAAGARSCSATTGTRSPARCSRSTSRSPRTGEKVREDIRGQARRPALAPRPQGALVTRVDGETG